MKPTHLIPCIALVIFIATGFTLVFMAFTPEREAGAFYTEGTCTLSFAKDACLYRIPGFENNWCPLSCDIMMPRISLAQYNLGSFKCYYRTLLCGNDITKGDILFEKPETPDLMMMIGFIMIIVGVIGSFVWFIWVRCTTLQRDALTHVTL